MLKEELIKEIIYDDLIKIKSWNDLTTTFIKYKYNLNYLKKYEGEDENNLLGSGGTGKVFRIGNTNRAIKISQHYEDARSCKKLLNKTPNHLINIYEISKPIINNKKQHVELIVMEYCSPLPDDLYNFLKKLFSKYPLNLKLNDYLTGEEDELNFLKKLDKNITEKYNLEKQFKEMKIELYNYGFTNRNDLPGLDDSVTNFLINSKGNLTFVDIVSPFG